MAPPDNPLTRELLSLYLETDALFAGWSCDESGTCCQFSMTGRQPELWPIEWRLLQAALRAHPPRKASLARADCPAFDPGARRCRAYDVRPFGCRTHFCDRAVPASKNPRAQIRELARRLAGLATRDEPRGTLRPLLSWHTSRRQVEPHER